MCVSLFQAVMFRKFNSSKQYSSDQKKEKKKAFEVKMRHLCFDIKFKK